MAIELKSAYLTVPVSDRQRSAEWYGRHFGFKVVLEDPMYLELVNETGVRILLQENKNGLHSHFEYPDGALQSSYGFLVPNAEHAYTYLLAEGVHVGRFFPDYQGQSFSFFDPDENFIEIWSLPNERAEG